MRLHLAIAMSVWLITFGCDSPPDSRVDSPPDPELQGEWQLRTMNGWFEFDLPTVKGGPTKIIFADQQFTFMNDMSPEQRVRGTFGCDQGKRYPEITFHFAGRRVVGIYYVSGSKLQICFGKDDLAPPATFSGGPDERPALLEFYRPNAE